MTAPNAVDAAEAFDATTAAQFIHTVYSKEVVVAREANLIFADNVDRRFERDATYGSSVTIHSISDLVTVTTKTSSTAHGSKVATQYVSVTDTDVTITIGTWQYSAIAVDTYAKTQADMDIYSKYAPKQGYDLAVAIDDVLAGLVDDFSQTVGTLLTELSYEDLLRADQYLDDADAPQENRVIGISPAQKAGFLKLDQFVNGDFSKLNGSVTAANRAATLGTFMGKPVFVSTNVEGTNAAGHDCGLWHKEALALVVQLKPRADHFYDVDSLEDKYVVQQIHGSGEIRDDHGVWMKAA